MEKHLNKSGGIKEIARRANVAIATVDRVIHNRPGVSNKTRAKINAIIKELDYKPNLLARRLASRKIYRFAVLIPKVSAETDFWEAPLKGIERAESEISQYGVNILKYFFDLNNKDSFVEQANIILKNEVDGVLVAPLFIEESIKFTNSCKELKVPYVFINSDIPNHEKVIYFGPNLFQSGYLAGHLMKYGISNEDKILIVNISKETDDKQHLLRIEEGFKAYFKDQHKSNEILKVHVKQTDYSSVEKNLSDIFEDHTNIRAIFAPNSRVSSIACYIEEAGIKNLLVVGFDFIEKNIHYLKKDTIDFLICQKPEEQGYKAIKALYQMLVLALPVKKINYMPNDVITKENHHFYHN